jgi:hypothetical protein
VALTVEVAQVKRVRPAVVIVGAVVDRVISGGGPVHLEVVIGPASARMRETAPEPTAWREDPRGRCLAARRPLNDLHVVE